MDPPPAPSVILLMPLLASSGSVFRKVSFNIGIEKPEISVRDLAELVIRISGRPLKWFETSLILYLTDNPNRRCPDITKARGYWP
jgi:nucleoside-diphosphate-sugar epimerase